MKKKLLCVFITVLLAISAFAGCGNAAADNGSVTAASAAAVQESIPSKDRSGNPITVPDKVSTIISMAPSVTQELVELGLGDRIIACDTQSPSYTKGLKDGIPQFDMMAPDQEKIIALKADIVFTSGMSSQGGEDAYKAVRDAGICVADIPSSTSIKGIGEDIRFVGDCVGKSSEAKKMADDMNSEVSEIKAISSKITDKKKVLFEIAESPEIYSAGKNTYIDEIISDIGAENACADQDSWCSVTDESAVAANPDVILTNVNYVKDAVADIKALDGWKEVSAVKNGEVYYIDNAASSLPNGHITDAMKEMAKDVYPDAYKDLR